MGSKKIYVEIDDELHQAFKTRLASSGLTMRAVVVDLIGDWIDMRTFEKSVRETPTKFAGGGPIGVGHGAIPTTEELNEAFSKIMNSEGYSVPDICIVPNETILPCDLVLTEDVAKETILPSGRILDFSKEYRFMHKGRACILPGKDLSVLIVSGQVTEGEIGDMVNVDATKEQGDEV
jgi:hypothetical protein